MKKKRIPASDPVIPSEILDQARQSAHPDKLPAKVTKCVVCGGECAPTSTEQLCWVCRRLKISAWHESEQQMPAQE
jgi:hypothetical protein